MKFNANVDFDWTTNETKIQHKIVEVTTVPFPDQRSKTNFPVPGHQSRSENFLLPGYVENFVQAVLSTTKPSSIAVGGFGTRFSDQVLSTIVCIAAANDVATIYLPEGGILSRPAASLLASLKKCWCFLVHKSCYEIPRHDSPNFGIDLLTTDGRHVDPSILDQVFSTASNLNLYKIVPSFGFTWCKPSTKSYYVDKKGKIDLIVVDMVENYNRLVRNIFDFDRINALLSGFECYKQLTVLIDCNGGTTAPYVERIFRDELRISSECVVNRKSTDVESRLIIDETDGRKWDVKAKLSGDGCRCRIYGRDVVVESGETVAIVVSQLSAIPYFVKNGFQGAGCTLTTSSVLDDIVKTTTIFELEKKATDGLISIYEDDNFRIGSNHIAVSDGLWTLLTWLSLIGHCYSSIDQILRNHRSVDRRLRSTYEFHDLETTTIFKLFESLRERTELSKAVFQVRSRKYKIVNMSFYSVSVDDRLFDDKILRVDVERKGTLFFQSTTDGNRGSLKIVAEIDDEKSTDRLFILALRLCRLSAGTLKFGKFVVRRERNGIKEN